MSGESYIVELKAEGAGPPGIVRLRRLLKAALRAFGLRCTSVSAANPPSATPLEAQRTQSKSMHGSVGDNPNAPECDTQALAGNQRGKAAPTPAAESLALQQSRAKLCCKSSNDNKLGSSPATEGSGSITRQCVGQHETAF